MIRLLLVDDQPAVRKGLRMRLALEPDLVVVGEAGDGQSALELAAAQSPDVVILDLEMPGMDGIVTAAALRARGSGGIIVILSIHDESAFRSRAMAAGAFDFVVKNGGVEPLLEAIHRAAHRSSWDAGQ